MTVLELPPSVSPVRWTEVCAADHRADRRLAATRRPAAASARTAIRPASTGRGRGAAPTAPGVRPGVRTRPAGSRATAGAGVRACRPSRVAPAAIVDDVPAWVLLACGVIVGLLMVLALAFIGGPTYA